MGKIQKKSQNRYISHIRTEATNEQILDDFAQMISYRGRDRLCQS